MKHPKRNQYRRLTTQSLALFARLNALQERQRELYPQVLSESVVLVNQLLTACIKKPTHTKLLDLKLEVQILAGIVSEKIDKPSSFLRKMRRLCQEFTNSFQELYSAVGEEDQSLVMHIGGSFTAISEAIDE
jgi:DNA-binding MarR family transcriptional regulator